MLQEICGKGTKFEENEEEKQKTSFSAENMFLSWRETCNNTKKIVALPDLQEENCFYGL
jgi:hypothetical protein